MKTAAAPKAAPGEGASARKLRAAAFDLFQRYGYRRVKVEEICRAAGVSRMTFYRLFQGRDDIAVDVLGRYYSERMAAFERILAERTPFVERLSRILQIKLDRLRSSADELAREILLDRESVPGRFLGELFERQKARTREIFLELQRRGEIRRDVRVEVIMFILENAWRAVADERLLAAFEDKSSLYRDLFKAVYGGLLPPRKTGSEVASCKPKRPKLR